MRTHLLELAEEPNLSLPPVPGRELLELDEYVVAATGRRASVERIRLGDVERAVADLRELARRRGLERVTWWVGERSTPSDLFARLVALGLTPDVEMPVSRTLTISARPAGEPTVEVHPVETFADYLQLVEIDETVWPVARERPSPDDRWEALTRSGRARQFLGYLDGRPVGFGQLVLTREAGLLMGGGVLPEARGRGVYQALVHARWNESVARGVPRLLVGAGAMSAPILEQMGFERLGEIRLLVDAVSPGAQPGQ